MCRIIPRRRLGSSRNIFRSHLTTDLIVMRTLAADEVRCFQGMKGENKMVPSRGCETLTAGGHVVDLLACDRRLARYMVGIAYRNIGQ